jgi:hypothetical protein
MQIKIEHNIDVVKQAMEKAASQVPFSMMTALNKTAAKARDAVRAEMPRVFDRPTPWVLNSLRIKYATKARLSAEMAFKDSWSSSAGEVGGKTMIAPHVFGGGRSFKGMEVRLYRAGILPTGWTVVPGGGAKLDAYGNMSRGQITTLLNVLGTYTESGYNKANSKTIARLAKGNVKKNIYGFTYWVNPAVAVGSARGLHLPPGVYQRVTTGFGSSLKPILIFVNQARYKKRLPFFETAQKVVDAEFPGEFNKAFDEAMRTALLKTQGNLL